MRRWMIVCALAVMAGSCSTQSEAAAGEEVISARTAADMVYAALAADRAAYTRQVVNRLVKEQKVTILDPVDGLRHPLRASEQWRTEPGTLPLPAQMFRLGAEAVTEQDIGLSYVLLSEWPINDQNRPKTRGELEGLQDLARTGGDEPFYTTEVLGSRRYLTAVYADVAVADACVDYHNAHPDSPRDDFAVGDVMGAVVIRIAL